MSADVKSMLRERMDGWRKLRLKHIPIEGDLTMVVLKTHLVLEETMTSIICGHCAIPEDLPDARLSFAQKLKLAYALTGFPFGSEVMGAVSIINVVRNDFAHNLESKKLRAHLLRAREIAESIQKETKPGDPRAELKDDVGTIHFLAGYCCAYFSMIDTFVHLFKKDAPPTRLSGASAVLVDEYDTPL